MAKLETTNPGGSSKDRPALEMVLAAERDGLLPPGGTIVEPTSGNTGVGLAIVAAQRGYRCHFVMTDKVAPEKVDSAPGLRRRGGRSARWRCRPRTPTRYYSTAERLVREIPGAFRPNQYANPANPLAHEETTGPEIWRQTAGRITHFVAGAGNGGTITGVARYLKRMNPEVQVIAADPEGSVYSGGSGRPYLVEGVGEDFCPDAWDPSVRRPGGGLSATRRRSSWPAGWRARRACCIGGSGGLAVAAAIKVGRRPRPLTTWSSSSSPTPAGATCRGCSTTSGWPATASCAECDLCVGAVLDARSEDMPALLYVNPEQTVREAVALMRGHGVSQLPVCKGELPFAAAEVIGRGRRAAR